MASESAFPTQLSEHDMIAGGLTKREWFAGQALAMLSDWRHYGNDEEAHQYRLNAARVCYMYADAMLEAGAAAPVPNPSSVPLSASTEAAIRAALRREGAGADIGPGAVQILLDEIDRLRDVRGRAAVVDPAKLAEEIRDATPRIGWERYEIAKVETVIRKHQEER